MIVRQISANHPSGIPRSFHSTPAIAASAAARSTRLMVQALGDEIEHHEGDHKGQQADGYSRQAAAVKDWFAHVLYVAISAGGDNGPAS